jgi:HK97 family phage portal protein
MAFDLDLALTASGEGKALGAHPAFMDPTTPVSVYSPGTPREKALISQHQAGHHQQAYGGNEAIDWVYDCINLYVDGCSTAPYKLTKKDGTKLVQTKTKGTPPDHEVGPEELYNLLDKPNPFMLYSELVSLMIIDLMLVGNAYWFKWQTNSQGQPLALYRLAPSHVKIKPDKYGPSGYEYQPPGVKSPLKIAPENIVHFRRPNPHSQFYGMGVIQGGGRAMDLELAITDTMASYYENKADPSLIVSSERRVPRDVFKKLGAQLRARTAGPRNSGELLVLEAGLKASSLSASARDALFQELSKMSRDRIFTKFRASPMLFGLMDETAGSNKVSDVRREFDNYALRPFMGKLAEQISAAVADLWDCKYAIDYRQQLPVEEAVKVGESIAKIPGIKVREVRRQYEQFGIEESTGDPELDELVLNKPLGDLDENGQPIDPRIQSGADPNLSSEPGRPPKPSNTTAIGQGKSLEEAMAALEVRISEAKAVSTPAPDNRLPGEQRPDDPFARARTGDINSAVTYMELQLQDAAVALERGLLDTVEGKALKTTDIVARIRRSPAWKTFRERLEAILEEGARRAAASGALHSGLEPEDDVDYDAIVRSVIHRPEGVRSILKTIRDRVANRVKAARDKDGERQDFEAAVREAVGEWTTSQAQTIAESEAVHAYNEATLTVAEATGVTQVYVEDGHDHDEPCREADGSVWDIEYAREHRLEHPRCRRAFLPLTEGAVA